MADELASFANEVASDVVQNEGIPQAKAFNPLIIGIIIQIISLLINIWKLRHPSASAETIQAKASNMGLLQFIILKNRVKRSLKNPGEVEDFDQLFRSSVRKIKTVDLQKLQGVIRHVESQPPGLVLTDN